MPPSFRWEPVDGAVVAVLDSGPACGDEAVIGEGARRYRLGRATIARLFEATTPSTRWAATVITLRYVQRLSGDTLMSRSS
jgi:hypothetical protein